MGDVHLSENKNVIEVNSTTDLPWIMCLHRWQLVGLRKTCSWKQWVMTGSTGWAKDFGWVLVVCLKDSDGLIEGERDDNEGLGLVEGEWDGERS